ncbi:MAG: O-antigen ligase [Desulfurococcaceae archaeon]
MWFALYGMTFLLILGRLPHFIKLALKDKLLLLLVGLAFISVAWSREPAVTLRRSLALIGTTLFGMYLAMRFSLREWLTLLAWALGLAALLSLVFALLIPSWGVMQHIHEGSWRGIYVHKNILGRIMVIAMLALILLQHKRGLRAIVKWLLVTLAIGLVVLSGSATALVIAFMLLVLLPLFRALRWQVTLVIPLVIILVLAGGAIATWLVANYEPLLLALGRDATLTGRTELWGAMVHAGLEKPLLGYGFGAFWLGYSSPAGSVWQAVRWEPLHGHNGYLDLWLELGLIGAVIYLVWLVSIAGRAIHYLRCNFHAAALWPPLFLSLTLVYNLVESNILQQNHLIWVLFVATAYSLARPYRQLQFTTPTRSSEQ